MITARENGRAGLRRGGCSGEPAYWASRERHRDRRVARDGDHFLVPVFPESVSSLLVGAGLAIASIALIGCAHVLREEAEVARSARDPDHGGGDGDLRRRRLLRLRLRERDARGRRKPLLVDGRRRRRAAGEHLPRAEGGVHHRGRRVRAVGLLDGAGQHGVPPQRAARRRAVRVQPERDRRPLLLAGPRARAVHARRDADGAHGGARVPAARPDGRLLALGRLVDLGLLHAGRPTRTPTSPSPPSAPTASAADLASVAAISATPSSAIPSVR